VVVVKRIPEIPVASCGCLEPDEAGMEPAAAMAVLISQVCPALLAKKSLAWGNMD
jgi:hypothetical protein